jgi:hypothetical protein
MNTSNWTGRCPRTLTEALGCTGHAIEVYRTPPIRRFFYACIRHGWLVVAAVLAVLVLTGCDEIDSQERTAASLRDALAQAQKDRPELWTAERKKRADVAVGIVAKGDRHE